MGRQRKSVRQLVTTDLAKSTGISTELASFIYETLFNSMRKKIEKGEIVVFPGIGKIVQVPSRSIKSNMVGVMIPEHKRIKFKPNVRLARKIRVESRVEPINI